MSPKHIDDDLNNHDMDESIPADLNVAETHTAKLAFSCQYQIQRFYRLFFENCDILTIPRILPHFTGKSMLL